MSQVGINGPSANDEVLGLPQQVRFSGGLQGVVHLHGDEGGKVGRSVQAGQRMSARRHWQQVQSAGQGSDHHHFPCDVTQRHAQQGRLAFV